jgi:hypothetical protein
MISMTDGQIPIISRRTIMMAQMKGTHVDMLYFAALYSPARTYPTTAAPITAFKTLRDKKARRTMIANVTRERTSFALWGANLALGSTVEVLSGESDDRG